MQVIIELTLKTREVFKLFERKIKGDRLFMDAILHKFNQVMQRYDQQPSVVFTQIEQAMHLLTQQFIEEINRFESILANYNHLSGKKIHFTPKFYPKIIVSNPLGIHLIEFIEVYDQLVATLKLLNLAGCFISEKDYYANVKRVQSLANQMLSFIMLMPTAHRTLTQ